MEGGGRRTTMTDVKMIFSTLGIAEKRNLDLKIHQLKLPKLKNKKGTDWRQKLQE